MHRGDAIRLVAAGVAVGLTAWLFLQDPFAGLDRRAVVWPVTGLTFFACWRLGWRGAIAVFLGQAVGVGFVDDRLWTFVVPLSAVDALVALGSATLVRRIARGRGVTTSVTGMMAFLYVACGLAPLVEGAADGAIWWTQELVTTWRGFAEHVGWFGLTNALGTSLVGGTLLAWSERTRAPEIAGNMALRTALVGATGLLVLWLTAMTADTLSATHTHPLVFFLIPVTIVGALRVPPLHAHGLLVLFAALIIAGSMSGFGPFAMEPGAHGLLALAAYLLVITVTTQAVLGSVNASRRLSDRLRSQARTERMLLEELDHRVRNNLGSLEAMVGLLSSDARNVDDLAARVRERLRSMTVIYTALRAHGMERIDLGAFLREMRSINCTHAEQLFINGPRVQLSSEQGRSLGMALFELATNSQKHGALQRGESVKIRWELQPDDTLAVHWEEPFEGPSRGFAERMGLRLVRGFVEHELKGRLTIVIEHGRLRFDIVFRMMPTLVPPRTHAAMLVGPR
jgi:two-component sensor histidine kinase/integral membrane sensor domain MASE1